jgi:hypothetical protein
MSNPPKSRLTPIEEDYVLTPLDGEPGEPIVLTSKEDDDPEVELMLDAVPTRALLRRTTKALFPLTFFGRITQSHWLACYAVVGGIAAAVYWGFFRG